MWTLGEKSVLEVCLIAFLHGFHSSTFLLSTTWQACGLALRKQGDKLYPMMEVEAGVQIDL